MLYHDGFDDFHNLDVTVEETIKNLRERLTEFDSIVVTGISGQCVGFPVALALGKAIICLRKDDETTHGIPGALLGARHVVAGERVLFLDDFLGVGGTLNRCREAVEKIHAKVVASYWYRDHYYHQEHAS